MNAQNPCLTAVDIDDTMFKTTAKIWIVDKNTREIIEKVGTAEFAARPLAADEDVVFTEFSDARKFAAESYAIDWMLNHSKILLRQIKRMPGSEMILLTARCDLDDKQLFLDTFRRHSFEIDSTYVERAGNLGTGPTSENKQVVIRKYIRQERFKSFRMFDDSKSNLRAFLELKKERPDLNFYAYHVDGLGRTQSFEPLAGQPLDELYEVTAPLADLIEGANLRNGGELYAFSQALQSKAEKIQAQVKSEDWKLAHAESSDDDVSPLEM
jgi:hypothetical protein